MAEEIFGNETADAFPVLGSFSEDNLALVSDKLICYGLINGWIREEKRRR